MLKVLSLGQFNFKRFFIGEGPQPVPYILTYRRVYILPTKQGLVFSLLLLAMLLGSINYNNSLGYILTFLLASLAVVAIFMTYHNLLYLKVGPAMLGPVFAGTQTLLAVNIDNHNYQQRYAVGYFLPKCRAEFSDIHANKNNIIKLPVKFRKRGHHALPRFKLETTFPLGLFRAWAHVQLQQSILVYPHPASDSRLPQGRMGAEYGERHQTRGNDDYDGLKNYQFGDSLYRVHWKSAARYPALQTKHYIGNASDALWIDWDDSVHTNVELRLSQLTKWVILADKMGIPFGLRIPGTEIALSSGLPHRNECLKALALYGKTDVSA